VRLRLAGASVPHQISVIPEVETFQQTHPATALVYQHERVNTGGLSPARSWGRQGVLGLGGLGDHWPAPLQAAQLKPVL
jgi:hypothetical protein